MKSKWGKRIGYGIGDLGCNLVFSTMSSYLLIFYTGVFGIAAAAAGTMMLVTKLIDAITDTVMGMIVDKTHTKWGQGRPYFVIGAIPFAVFTVLTFIVPDLSEGGKLVWAYVTYCLLCTAYTVVNIPLNTIVPRLSADPNERNILVTTRMVCALLGTAIVMSITTPFVKFAANIVDPGIADPFKSPKAKGGDSMQEHLQKFKRFLDKTDKANEGEILEKRNIVFNCKSVTPEEAIRACGNLLLKSDCIDEGYIQAMLERDRSSSVAVGSHTALPHSDNEARKFVKKTGLAVMTYPDGINWHGEKVRLVIGIASKGEDHLDILHRVAAIAVDEEAVDKLVDSTDLNTLYASLNGLDMTKVSRPLLEKKNIILNCKSVTPEEAIRSCGQLMLESGYANEGYIQSMLERNASVSVAVGNHVAIPHGTAESQKFIKRTGLVVMTYPDGIQWEDKLVRLVIGIASKGEEHLAILDRVVEMTKSDEDTNALVANATEEELYKKLNGLT